MKIKNKLKKTALTGLCALAFGTAAFNPVNVKAGEYEMPEDCQKYGVVNMYQSVEPHFGQSLRNGYKLTGLTTNLHIVCYDENRNIVDYIEQTEPFKELEYSYELVKDPKRKFKFKKNDVILKGDAN